MGNTRNLCVQVGLFMLNLRLGETRISSYAFPELIDAGGNRDNTAKRQGEGPAHDQDANGRFIGDSNQDCTESLFVTPTRTVANIDLDDDVSKEADTKCHWNVIGTELCNPILECQKFKLADGKGPADDKCEDEYVEVTDGVKGHVKFCGTEGPKALTTTSNLRDLYITYKSGDGEKKRQLSCTVTCSTKRGEGTPLPSTFEGTFDNNCNCGRKPNGDRIVGGEDAKKGEFPWMAGLVTAKTRKPFCGGTVINSQFILTAAHCFKGPYMKKENMEILLNGHFMDLTSSKVASGQGGDAASDFATVTAQDKKEGAVRFSVEKYYLHPLYVRQTNDYDVALIKLTEPIDFAKYTFISPACFPDVASYETTYEGLPALVAGWGLNSSDAAVTMGTLQKLDVKVFTIPECKQFFDERFSRRMLCAGYKEAGKDSCKGDSGGPLIREKSKQVWELIGAVSWGEGCAAGNSPGVYVRLSEVEQWVRYISNNEDASWCRS